LKLLSFPLQSISSAPNIGKKKFYVSYFFHYQCSAIERAFFSGKAIAKNRKSLTFAAVKRYESPDKKFGV